MLFKNNNITYLSNLYNLLNQKFKKKKNIQLYLKKRKIDKKDIIKISYDVQSGSYIDFFSKLSRKKVEQIYNPIIENLNKEFSNFKSVLDFGCGELTSSFFIFRKIKKKIKYYYANDVSLNRLIVGQNNLKKKLKASEFKKIKLFCNSNFDLPFKDNSIDVIMTIHSLEPNNKSKKKIAEELLRVSRKGLILMEPHYEISSRIQKKRMKKFNYITSIKSLFNKDLCSIKIIKKKYHLNKNNISSIFIIKKKINKKKFKSDFVDPKSKKDLIKINNFYYSYQSLRLFPIFNEIPIFSDETQLFLPSIKNML